MNLFIRRKDRLPYSSADLVRVASLLEMGLRSGRDWISVLIWISKSDPQPKVRQELEAWIHRLRIESVEKSIREESARSKSPLWILFLEILRQSQRGAVSTSVLLRSFCDVGHSLIDLQRQESSLLFVPIFQSWVSLFLTIAFAVGLPLLSGDLFPSFISLGRPDLFWAGMSVIIIGFFCLQWLCRRPERNLKPLLSVPFFFQFLSIQLEVGLDFVSAWYQSLQSIPFSPRLKNVLSRPGLSVETMDDFLLGLRSQLASPWPEVITGVLWAKSSGVGLSSFLKDSSDNESRRLLRLWEAEVRKTTMLALLPLGLMIFPASLFLLVGPQFLQLMKNL